METSSLLTLALAFGAIMDHLIDANNVCAGGCVRGVCLSVTSREGITETCECGIFYEGGNCESANLDIAETMIGSSFISFTWSGDSWGGALPNLTDFVFFVYLRHSVNLLADYSIVQPTGDVENAINVGATGLNSGGNSYVVCLLHASTDLNNRTESQLGALTHERRKSCFSFVTGYDENDPYTKAAIWVAVALGITLGLIFLTGIFSQCCRKNAPGHKLRRSFKSSWKFLMTDDGKPRIQREDVHREPREKYGIPNDAFVTAFPENPAYFDGTKY